MSDTQAEVSDQPSVAVRGATPADAELLASLGARTFEEAFGAQNTPTDMAAYLAANFTPAKLAQELPDSSNRFLIAEVDGETAGYAKLHVGEPPSGSRRSRPIELSRIYALAKWLGRGVGHVLMQRCIDEARAAGAETIWLGVWERNDRAIAFYRKWGFIYVGKHDFTLGSDRQTDWIMELDLLT